MKMSEDKGILSFVKKLVFGKEHEDKNREPGQRVRNHKDKRQLKKKKHRAPVEEDVSAQSSSSSPRSSSSDSESSEEERHQKKSSKSLRKLQNSKETAATTSASSSSRNGASNGAGIASITNGRSAEVQNALPSNGDSSSKPAPSGEDPLSLALLKFKGRLIQSMDRIELENHLDTLGLSTQGTKGELVSRLSHAVQALKGEKSVLVDDMAKVRAPLASLSGGIPEEKYERLRRLLASRVQREEEPDDSFRTRLPYNRTAAADTSSFEAPRYHLNQSRHSLGGRHSIAGASPYVPGSVAKRTSDVAFSYSAHPTPEPTQSQRKRFRDGYQFDEPPSVNMSTFSTRAPGSVLKRPRDMMSSYAAASPAPPSADEVAMRILSTLGKLATPVPEAYYRQQPATSPSDLLLSKTTRPEKRQALSSEVLPASQPPTTVDKREKEKEFQPPVRQQPLQTEVATVPASQKVEVVAKPAQVTSTPVSKTDSTSKNTMNGGASSSVKPRFAFSPAAPSSDRKSLGKKIAPTPEDLSKFSFERSSVATEDGWICKGCGVDNEASSEICSLCKLGKGEVTKPPTSALKPPRPTEQPKTIEQPAIKKTTIPQASPPASATTTKPSGPVDDVFAMFRLKPTQWKCPGCSVHNENTSEKCVSCETENPNKGAAAASAAAGGEKKVKFGETRSEFVISGQKVLPLNDKAPVINPNTEKPAPAASFNFAGTSNDASSSSSGSAKSLFSIAEPSSTTPTTPAFSFGTSSTAAPSQPATTTSSGASASEKPAFNFGASSSSATPMFGSSATGSSLFGGGSTAARSTAPATSTADGGDASMLFGGTSTSSSGAGSSAFPFGSGDASNKKDTQASSLFGFGSSAAPAASGATTTTDASSSLFGGGSANSSEPPKQPMFSFGQTSTEANKPAASATVPSSVSPALFGSTEATSGAPKVSQPDSLHRTGSATSQGSAASGQATNPTPPPFTFGGGGASSSGQAAAPDNKAPFAFGGNTGATSTAPFAFGASSTSSNPSAPGTGSLFGGSAAPAPTSSATPMFGGAASSSTPMFGGAAASSTSAPSMFGGAGTAGSAPSPASSLFGGAANNPSAPTTSMFGGAPATTNTTSSAPGSSLFGGGSAAPSTGAPSFGFGASASGSAAAPPFAFGGAPAAPTGGVFGSAPPGNAPMFGGAGAPSGAGGAMFGGGGSFLPPSTPTPPPSGMFNQSQQPQPFGFGNPAPAMSGAVPGAFGAGFGANGGGVGFGAGGFNPGVPGGGFGGNGGFDASSASSAAFSAGTPSNPTRKRAVRPGQKRN